MQGAWRVHSLFPSTEGQWKVRVVPDPHFEVLKTDKLEIIIGTSCIFYEPTKYFLINIVVMPDRGRYIPWGIKNKFIFLMK